MAKNGVNPLLVIAVVLMGYVLIVGNPFEAKDEEPNTITDQGALKTCESTTTPDIDINAYDAENPGTASTEGANIYRKKGDVSWSTWTQGTAITGLEVGETYEAVMGITTDNFTDNAYGDVFEFTIPCAEVTTLNKPVYNDEVETSLSSTFYNADSDASGESFSAGQSQTVSLKILAGSDEYFGNPTIPDNNVAEIGSSGQRKAYPNVVCLNLNSTSWDKPEGVSFDGVDMKAVSQPQRHAAVAGFTSYCYEAPVVDDTLMENNKYLLRLNADDTIAATVDSTAYIYAANYYIDATDAKIKFGIENEEGTAVGTDAADTVTLDFTA